MLTCFFTFIDVPDTNCISGDVRLTYQQQGGAAGNLEICFENQWQAACSAFFFQAALNVTCRSLGFDEYEDSQFNHVFLSDPVINTSTPVLAEFITCSGSENSLSQCSFGLEVRRKRQESCSPEQVLGVVCQCESWHAFSNYVCRKRELEANCRH